jgi:uncharacterized RDD family membrane protein YckC
MSNDEPTHGQPPRDDPFLKRPQEPGPPPGGSEPGSPHGAGGPYGDRGGGRGGGGGGGGGAGFGGGFGGGAPPPPYGRNPYGSDPYGGRDPFAGMPPLAPFGTRLAARIIDALIVAIPLAIIALAANGFDLSTSNGESEVDSFSDQVNTGQQWLWTLVSIAAYIGYDTWMTTHRGRTLGKRWLKLRVGMLANGDVPDSRAALVRATVLWLPALLCCYLVWWLVIAVTILASRPYRQGWHDKAAKTVVVGA